MAKIANACFLACAVVAAVTAASSVRASAGDELLTREQADALIEELRETRKLLERVLAQGSEVAPERMATAQIAITDRPAIGDAAAPVTIVEFTDYECPYCKRFHESTFSSIKRDYIDTGKVRWVVRDLPLAIHPRANVAARAAHCAGEQKQFWEFRAEMFARAPLSDDSQLITYARNLKLDEAAFTACLQSNRYKDQVASDLTDANAAGIGGTPTFVIGRVGDGSVEGKRIVGAQSYAVFDSAIRVELNKQEP